MAPEKSGFYLPNKFARIYLEAIAEVVGKEGAEAILKLAGLEGFIGNPPPDNLEKSFDFSYFTAIQFAFDDAFDAEEGAKVATRVGRAAFPAGLRGFGELAGVTNPEFRALPLDERLRYGLPAMADIMRQFSDQISQAYPFDEETFVYTMERCPMCWKRESIAAACHTGRGLLLEALHWVSGGREFVVEIETCIAKGDEMGRYVIYREPIPDAD